MINDNIEGKLKKVGELLDRATFENIIVENISLEKATDNLISKANLFSFLKPSSNDSFDTITTWKLDAYQAPIIGYKTDTEKLKLVSGLFTFHKVCRLQNQSNQLTPCLVLPYRPTPELRRLIFLNDIVRLLLKQYFNASGPLISELLICLFKDEHSVLNSAEWRTLFPAIKTKTELCKWLKISTKVIKL
ncbi:hypothetical protein PESP_a2224 [Pseudoalteromonas espejiana DSM 9414]|uniref:Uncharacterized protein n=1 Tax=Pseudoalteromonas espejiana TaxID=28107 RepID=A0A510XSF2_9GAMM|nr:hypothetical protein [Pseudoalteromonas espejiana]ASM50224.1 hypothetical protein PESP_a2224 [Pseudoalteromonas espejiana DSM 9414]GEK53964.1 hypothetical protein PES01_08090 [Pseudoalteromonas espejiana]